MKKAIFFVTGIILVVLGIYFSKIQSTKEQRSQEYENTIYTKTTVVEDINTEIEDNTSKDKTENKNDNTTTKEDIKDKNDIELKETENKVNTKEEQKIDNNTVNKKEVDSPKIIEVESIELNKESEIIYLNSNSQIVNLTATISPYNANNKTVTWSSNNTNIAIVNNGIVTAKDIGEAIITAKSNNGKTATFRIVVKKKIIIEIGASQSQRFIDYSVNSYTKNNNSYSVDKKTLVHIAKSGAEISWQYSDKTDGGYTRLKNIVETYKDKKSYLEFYLYYLLIGNTIKDSSCSTINNNPKTYSDPLAGYQSASNKIKNLGYNIKPYVVSMHPVHPSSASSSSVVKNSSSSYCDKDKRSNWKYNLFNQKIKSAILGTYKDLTYADTFNSIMDTSSATSSNRTYSYKISYKCTDGVHWDKDTAKMYLKLMLDNSNANL